MARDLERLRAEAERLGLALTDDDLRAILALVTATAEGLGARPPQVPEDLEPPYRFLPIDEDRSDGG